MLGAEVPDLKRKPSEYLSDHLWNTTQPIEEPTNKNGLAELFEHLEELGLGSNVLFSSDYPHWDFDSPTQTLPRNLSSEQRQKIFCDNALTLYKLS